MKVYSATERDSDIDRCHPWGTAASDPSHRYYDFKKNPHLISKVLEDFIEYSAFPAIQRFYEMVEWVNGHDSPFESNDCAFSGIVENKDSKWSKKLQCSGRFMVFYREVELNVSDAHVEWLKGACNHYLSQLNTALEFGVVGINLMKVRYLALPENNEAGHEVSFTFWAWGDDEAEVMENLEEVFLTLFEALKGVAQELMEAMTEG